MKCLTVKQPWAALIVLGEKDIENRSWSTSYRGPLLIHAAKAPDLTAPADVIRVMPAACDKLGALVGYVEIVDCVEKLKGRNKWVDPAYGWHWKLSNAHPLEHAIPMQGRMGLYDVDDSWFEAQMNAANQMASLRFR